MITGLIALIIVIAVLPPAISNGSTGVIILVAVTVVFLLFFGYVSRKDARANVNRMNYWAMDGKDRARARHRLEAEARAEEAGEKLYGQRARRVSKREVREAALKRQAWRESMRNGNTGSSSYGRQAPLRTCHYCGRAVRAYGKKVGTSDGIMVMYTCPRCRSVNMTKLGA